MKEARQEVELDSLNLVAQGADGERKAREMYGTKFLSEGQGESDIKDFSEQGTDKFLDFYLNAQKKIYGNK